MTRRQYSDPFGSDEEDEMTAQDVNVINSTEEKKFKTNHSSIPISYSVDSVRFSSSNFNKLLFLFFLHNPVK